MADIVAANVTYSFISKDKQFEGRRGFSARGTISFGNASLTYPSGGVPMTKAKIGLPRVLRSMVIMESNAQGYTFEYDRSAETVRIFQQSAKAVTGNASAPTINIVAGANATLANAFWSNAGTLSANIANTSGIVGVQAPVLTMQNTSAGIFAELSAGSTAVAACVLEVVCEGY